MPKPCKYCEDLDVLTNAVCYTTTDNGNSYDIPMNFCPACGCPLAEPRILSEEELQTMNGEIVYIVYREDDGSLTAYPSLVTYVEHPDGDEVFFDALAGKGPSELYSTLKEWEWDIYDHPPYRGEAIWQLVD